MVSGEGSDGATVPRQLVAQFRRFGTRTVTVVAEEVRRRMNAAAESSRRRGAAAGGGGGATPFGEPY